MSNITGVQFVQQPLTFPASPPVKQSGDLETAVLNAWTGLENGDPINQKTVFELVQDAIRQKVQQTQNASSDLNSLTFGPQNQIGYAAVFVPPPANALQFGGGGTINVTLTVPGNNLAFTINTQTNPTFEVGFDLAVAISLTFPLSLGPQWTVGISANVDVEVTSVTTHNVAAFLCDQNAAKDVQNAINGQTVSLTDLQPPGLSFFETVVQAAAVTGWTQFVETDDGGGNVVLTAFGPELTINGRDNDSIVIDTTAAGLEVTAQGQTATLVGQIESLNVNPAGGANHVKVVGVSPGTIISVGNAQHGNNTVTVGGDLSRLAGTTIDIADSTGSTALLVDDTGDLTARVASITRDAVTLAELTTVNYSGNIVSLSVLGGKGSDQFFIATTAANTPTTVDAGPGTNSVFAGLTGTDATLAGTGHGSVRQLVGPLNVTDKEGTTVLAIDCSGDGFSSCTVFSDHVAFFDEPTVQFQSPGSRPPVKIDPVILPKNVVFPPAVLPRGVTSLTVYGAVFPNNFQVESVDPETQVTLFGTAQDTIGGPAAGSVTHKVYPPAKQVGPIHEVPQGGGG
jgi:hypothetical protein